MGSDKTLRRAEAFATEQKLNDLMLESLGTGPGSTQARLKAQKILALDDTNWTYFFCLYRKKKTEHTKPMKIFEPGTEPGEASLVYPLAIAPRDLLKQVPIVDYTQIRNSNYAETGKGVALWSKKMQAGSGSSLMRTRYLSKRLGIPEEKIRIGAKGTDLYIAKDLSIAAAQILQNIAMFKRGAVAEIHFHDIVSVETAPSIHALWQSPSFTENNKSYSALLAEPGLSHFKTSSQAYIPTLDSNGKLTLKRMAPGGHAFFAVEALVAAYRETERPKTTKPLVAAISNGEDLNSTPDSAMLGYVIREGVPIALVTTERTAVDRKGGLVSLVVDESETVSLRVLETAQAKEAGQSDLFANLPGTASTNLTLFNYGVLTPLLTREIQEIGEDEFLNVIAPDIISNIKGQFTQLEGAMGSTIMNLDRYWRKKYRRPLVHLINVDRYSRTDFFSPIKSAFDFFMQFHSDRFKLDYETMRLKNLRPGDLPEISLHDSPTHDLFYQDVDNVLTTFQGARIRLLDRLTIEGQIKARNIEFRGSVEITNHRNTALDLAGYKTAVFEDIQLNIPI